MRESAQSNGDDTVLKSGLIELAENCPKLLRPSLEPLITLLLEVSDMLIHVSCRRIAGCWMSYLKS